MSALIRSIATAVPSVHIAQQLAADLAGNLLRADDRHRASLSVLYRNTTIDHRGTVLLDDDFTPSVLTAASPDRPRGPTTAARLDAYLAHAAPLAAKACASAIAQANVPFKSIRHLVVASCTGFAAPGVDQSIINTLKLSPATTRTCVGFMGCHAAINALRVADALAADDPESGVLACCVELCSIHFQYSRDRGASVANALFSDGAAACVVMHDPAIASHRIASTASIIMPDSFDQMSWHIGDHGFEMHISPRVPETLARHLPAWIESWLAAHSLTVRDIHQWAIHPGGPHVIDAVERSLGLRADQTADSRAVLRKHGNMSSPTVLFILRELLRRPRPTPLVALAFGPGLAGEALLLR